MPIRMSLIMHALVILIVATIVATVYGQSERAAEIDRQLADRAELIAGDPENPHLLAEQAAGFYFEYLAVDGSGWITLLGFPNESQRERARTAGRSIDELTRRADLAVEQAILRLESLPGFADDLDLQREHQRLIEEERERRVPFLMAAGAAVRAHAEDSDENQRRQLLQRALLLEKLAPRLTGPIAARARLHAGLAAVELELDESAKELLHRILETDDAEPMVSFAAQLMLSSLAPGARDLERLAAEPAYARSLFHRLLIADRLFMKRRDRSLASAVQAYGSLLDLRFDASAEQARAAILMRLAWAAESTPSTDRPPLVVFAMAERSLAHGAGEEVIEPVTKVLARNSISERERAQGLLTLARLQHTSGRHLDAAAHYIQFAQDYSAQPIAERAIEIGLALAANRYSDAPSESRGVLHRGLDVAIASYPRLAGIDRWRFMAARLALSDGRFEDAVDHVDALDRSHELWLDGQLMRLEAMQQWVRADVDTSQREKSFEHIITAAGVLEAQIIGLIESAEDEHAALLQRKLHQVRIHRSAALLASGDFEEVIAALDGIENEPAVDSELLEKALSIRIDALQALGNPEDVRQQVQFFLGRAAPDRVWAVTGSVLANVQRRVEELQDQGRDAQARSIVRSELAPLADLLDEWMGGSDERFDFAFALKIADSHRTAEKLEDALRLYETLITRQPNALPLLLGQAESLYHLGAAAGDEKRLAQAMTIYRRLIAAGAGGGLHDTYWLAQLRSLQILDAIGRNTNQIVPQIQRLRLRDPALGGERLRTEFERLQNRYAD